MAERPSARFDLETLESDSRRARSKGPGGGHYRLLVVVDGTVSTFALPESGRITIGRARGSDLEIDHPSISRAHGAFECGGGESITFTDLGSRNGSRVRAKAVEANVAVELQSGDLIELGDVVLALQPWVSSRPGRRVRDHDYFEGRVEEECSRATRRRESFAVVRLWVQGADEGVEPAVLSALRGHDVLAKYAPGHYEVLVDTDGTNADVVAQRLVGALREAGVEARAGVAVFGRDGNDAERLVAVAGAAVRGLPLEVPSDPAMQRLRALVARVAPSNISVLILGETGVGKELLARAVHDASARAPRTFLAINCAALPEALLESELFGYERGAFSGANAAKPGLLEIAEGGTVFLDEIGEMPLTTQAKLLRVLQERELRRLGAVRARPIDVRFVSATNQALEAEVERGRFRGDLFFRLNGVVLELPPLRERKDEILPLAREFLVEAAAGRPVPDIGPEAVSLLLEYSWPGNIRELRNVIERAVLLCDDAVLRAEHLPVAKMKAPRAGKTETVAPRRSPTFAAATEAVTGEFAAVTFEELEAPSGLREQVMALEKERILGALERCAGNQSAAARALGISRNTLIARLTAYNTIRPRRSPPSR